MMARIAQLVECTLRIDRFCCAVERPAGGLQLPCVSFAELGLLRCRVALGTRRAPGHLATRTPAMRFAELGLLRRRVVLGTLGAAGHLALRPLPLPPRLLPRRPQQPLPRRRPRIPPPLPPSAPSAPAPSRSSNLTSLIRRASHSLDSAPAGTTLNDCTSSSSHDATSTTTRSSDFRFLPRPWPPFFRRLTASRTCLTGPHIFSNSAMCCVSCASRIPATELIRAPRSNRSSSPPSGSTCTGMTSVLTRFVPDGLAVLAFSWTMTGSEHVTHAT